MAAQPCYPTRIEAENDPARALAQDLLTKPRFCFDNDVHEVARAYLARTEPDPRLQFVYPSILCQSGQYYDFENPETFNWGEIGDLAHGLANQCRYGGHSKFFYSIAQHCFYASFLAPAAHRFEALMHDAHESVCLDMMTPLKIICPDYARIEKKGESAMRAAFGLPEHMSPEVKRVDLEMLATEYDQLMPREDQPWDVVRGVERMPGRIQMWSPNVAKTMWLRRFAELFFEWRRAPALTPTMDLSAVRLPPANPDGAGG